MRNLFTRLALLAVFLAAPFALKAQNSSSMNGVVTDSTGAVVPQTIVTLANTNTGISFTATTNSTGSYRFPNVPPNPGYTVTFARDGFANYQVTDVTLTVGSVRTQNATLSPGANTTIEVSETAATATINTTDASIGNNFDIQLLNDLPVQSRTSPAALFTLQPGYTSGSFTGARTDQSSVTIDGMDVNDIASGSNLGIVGNAPTDSVQEFKGTVAGLTAGQGTGSGGQFQLVTKSGTNTFHGNINEYHRDTSTVANTWFNNNNGLPRTPLIRNQFGGNIGGPIKRDKAFFFFDFNNDRIIQSASLARTVPTASYLAGNISYINSNAGCTGSSRSNTTPSCISTINSAQVATLDPQGIGFNPALLTFLNARYGHLIGGAYDATLGDGVNTIGYRFTTPTPQITYGYVGRLDYNLTPRQRIFAKFTVARENATQSAIELPGDPFTAPFTDRSYGYVVSHIWEIGQNKVNQLYFGDTVSEYDFGNLYNPTGANQYSFSKYIAGFTSGPYLSGSSQERRVPIPEVRDDFSWQIGHHTLNAGGTFKFIKTNSQLVNDFNFVTVGLSPYTALSRRQAPANAYFGSTTAIYDYFGAFNVALGSIAEVDSNYNYNTAAQQTTQGTGARRHYRYYQTEAYLGDVWKLTPKLTLDYGVRYQLYSVPYEATGYESIQNVTYQNYLAARLAQSAAGTPGSNAVPLNIYSLGGKANNAAPLYNPSYKDFAPRVAFSWNVLPKTVINGSAGIVYDRTVINAVNFIQDQSSQLFQQSVGAPQFDGYSNPRLGANLSYANPNSAPNVKHPFTPNIDDGSITGIVGAPDGLINNQFNNIIDPNLKDPYSIAYNFGMQQELPGHFLMRLNYVGRQGRRLLAQADASQLIDYPDKVSGQTLGAAMTALELQVRAHNGAAFNATPIAWFENVMGHGTAYNAASYGEPSETQLVVDAVESLVSKGDFADTMQAMAGYLVLPSNVAMASQWAGNTYLTNGGFSSYNGLLFTLSKNLSQGLQFDFNYTWSHSIDNTSQVANSIASGSGYGFLCDVVRPRECRANSDFDVQNVINSDFVYSLPFGHKKAFANNTPMWLDEVIGGWKVSGNPSWRSGVAITTSTTAFVAGYANNAPAILTGNKSDVATQPHKVGSSVLGFAACSTSTVCGNLSTNDFAYPTGFNIGNRNALRSPSSFGFDAGLAKNFMILPDNRLRLQFRADFFNVLNHPVFSSPNTDISQSGGAFGQINSTSNSPRVGQFALRLEF